MKIAFVIEAGVFDELCVLGIRLEFWKPGVEMADEGGGAQFIEIREKNRTRTRRHQREKFPASRTAVPGPSLIAKKNSRALCDYDSTDPPPTELLHFLCTIRAHT